MASSSSSSEEDDLLNEQVEAERLRLREDGVEDEEASTPLQDEKEESGGMLGEEGERNRAEDKTDDGRGSVENSCEEGVTIVINPLFGKVVDAESDLADANQRQDLGERNGDGKLLEGVVGVNVEGGGLVKEKVDDDKCDGFECNSEACLKEKKALMEENEQLRSSLIELGKQGNFIEDFMQVEYGEKFTKFMEDRSKLEKMGITEQNNMRQLLLIIKERDDEGCKLPSDPTSKPSTSATTSTVSKPAPQIHKSTPTATSKPPTAASKPPTALATVSKPASASKAPPVNKVKPSPAPKGALETSKALPPKIIYPSIMSKRDRKRMRKRSRPPVNESIPMFNFDESDEFGRKMYMGTQGPGDSYLNYENNEDDVCTSDEEDFRLGRDAFVFEDNRVCPLCNKICHKSRLLKHLINLHYIKELECPNCPTIYPTWKCLKKHLGEQHNMSHRLIKHQEKIIYTPAYNNGSSWAERISSNAGRPNEMEVSRHFSELERKIGAYQQNVGHSSTLDEEEICTSDEEDFEAGKDSITSESRRVCPICQKVCKVTRLYKHVMISHYMNKLSCPNCSKLCSSTRRLKKHRLHFHQTPNKVLKEYERNVFTPSYKAGSGWTDQVCSGARPPNDMEIDKHWCSLEEIFGTKDMIWETRPQFQPDPILPQQQMQPRFQGPPQHSQFQGGPLRPQFQPGPVFPPQQMQFQGHPRHPQFQPGPMPSPRPHFQPGPPPQHPQFQPGPPHHPQFQPGPFPPPQHPQFQTGPSAPPQHPHFQAALHPQYHPGPALPQQQMQYQPQPGPSQYQSHTPAEHEPSPYQQDQQPPYEMGTSMETSNYVEDEEYVGDAQDIPYDPPPVPPPPNLYNPSKPTPNISTQPTPYDNHEENSGEEADTTDEEELKLAKVVSISTTRLNRICPLCEKISRTKRDLRFHIHTMHNSGKISCPDCPERFPSTKSLQKHIVGDHHRNKSSYRKHIQLYDQHIQASDLWIYSMAARAEVPNETQMAKYYVELEKKIRSKREKAMRPKITSGGARQQKVQQILHTPHQSSPAPPPPRPQPSAFSSKRNLEPEDSSEDEEYEQVMHEFGPITDFGPETRQSKRICPICDSIVKKNGLKEHLLVVHHLKKAKCPICTKEFLDRKWLIMHMVDSHDYSKQQYEAGIGNKFRQMEQEIGSWLNSISVLAKAPTQDKLIDYYDGLKERKKLKREKKKLSQPIQPLQSTSSAARNAEAKSSYEMEGFDIDVYDYGESQSQNHQQSPFPSQSQGSSGGMGQVGQQFPPPQRPGMGQGGSSQYSRYYNY